MFVGPRDNLRARHRRALRRGRSATGVALTERVRVITVADARTDMAHLVTDDAAVSGRHAGRYRAVCGELVLAASLTAPERRYCRTCAHWKAAR